MTEQNNNDIKQTVEESKHLSNLYKDYLKLEIIDKGSAIFSTLVLIVVIIAIATIAVFCICMAIYHSLVVKTNDPVLSYSIIALSLLFICLIIILLRKKLIDNALIRLFSKVLFNGKK